MEASRRLDLLDLQEVSLASLLMMQICQKSLMLMIASNSTWRLSVNYVIEPLTSLRALIGIIAVNVSNQCASSALSAKENSRKMMIPFTVFVTFATRSSQITSLSKIKTWSWKLKKSKWKCTKPSWSTLINKRTLKFQKTKQTRKNWMTFCKKSWRRKINWMRK